MSCWHGWHGCGPWHAGPYWPGWREPPEWYADPGWTAGPRYRRGRVPDRGSDVADLEARLAELREEMRRIEAELLGLRGADEEAEAERYTP